MAQVELTRHLHSFFPALAAQPIEVEATTIAEVVAALENLAPGFAFYVCDERGRLRMHVNIFIGEERIADRSQLSDRVDERSRVYILQALSGG
ncbi:MAG: MoaD/ThiS family protein [Myxococcales bacterium]|nr:MoaD/ThiS family protein [Myxococcales bacterium]